MSALGWFCWGGTISLWLLMFIRLIVNMRAARRIRTDRKRRT